MVKAFEVVVTSSVVVIGLGILGRGSVLHRSAHSCDVLGYGALLDRWTESFSLVVLEGGIGAVVKMG